MARDKLDDLTADLPKPSVTFAENQAAPFIFFDGTACHGSIHGVVEIELAARFMAPADGSVEIKYMPVGRLRCSPAAAKALRASLDAAIQMAEKPQAHSPAAAYKLN
jgi:hypothetical protein